MKIGITLILFLFSSARFLMAQNAGIGTSNPDASAKLEVSSTNSGVLLPQINLVSISDVSTISSPADGLLIYNTNAGIIGGDGTGYYYFENSRWYKFETSESLNTIGDIKYGFQAGDHDGWIKLDGRLLTMLTPSQQAAASLLGLLTNLPDATDRVLKQGGSVNTTGGDNLVTVNQTNLPNVNLSGFTYAYGLHNHTGSTGSSGNHAHGLQDYGYSTAGTGGAGLDDSFAFASQSDVTMDENDLTYTYSAGSHTHVVYTSTSGAHTHSATVASGGNGDAINVENAYLSTNVFLYLGE